MDSSNPILSKNRLFDIYVLNNSDKKEYQWVMPHPPKKHEKTEFTNTNINDPPKKPERKYYLVAEPTQEFQIKMAVGNDDNRGRVYGAKLFIDGREIVFNKTFKGHGHFFGVKRGGGKYKAFIFAEPEPLSRCKKANEPDVLKNLIDENQNFGQICIKFFETRPIRAKKREKKLMSRRQLEPSVREDNKKFFMRSMTVDEGKGFEIKNTYREYLDAIPSEFYEEHVLLENEQIDEVIIHYADFMALQVMGVVNILYFYDYS